MRIFAPVALFVYNRPKHTLQTLKALFNNRFFQGTKITIYSDGPAHDSDIEKVMAVREIVKKHCVGDQFKLVFRSDNFGLARSIIEGVTELVNENGRVIVLEDDLVTSPGFLEFMNDALDQFAQQEQVMHISGYVVPVKKLPEHPFFVRQASCWGWATWKSRWQQLKTDSTYLHQELLRRNLVYDFNMKDSYPFIEHLSMNAEGKLNTWAIKWYASIFLKNGLCLHPPISLVENIGNDGSGAHRDTAQYFKHRKLATRVQIGPLKLEESDQALAQIIRFNRQSRRISIIAYLKSKLKNFF